MVTGHFSFPQPNTEIYYKLTRFLFNARFLKGAFLQNTIRIIQLVLIIDLLVENMEERFFIKR